jgi:FKBP-type peptidyl-prolyl cis-trans isomerase
MRPSATPLRAFKIAAALAAISLATVACNPSTKDSGKEAKESAAAEKKESGAEIPGLPTEKAQISYAIGLDMGRSLERIKDEVDMTLVTQGVQDVFDGKDPKITDEQAMQIMQAFATRMQAKEEAENKAKAEKNLAEGKQFLEANAKKAGVTTTASGLQYQVLTAGAGPKPAASDTVVVHYTGTLLDGKEFDSSVTRGEPARFSLDGVVPGFTEGLQLMPVGGKYRFWIPGNLGYGEQGTPGGPIPPNATLVFDIELIEIAK